MSIWTVKIEYSSFDILIDSQFSYAYTIFYHIPTIAIISDDLTEKTMASKYHHLMMNQIYQIRQFWGAFTNYHSILTWILSTLN